MREFIAHLTERIKRTAEVESFRFKIKDKIDFFPGQAARVIFDGQNIENRQLNKYLSFSSSPAKDYLELTKKLSTSKFSQNLKDLRLGDKVQIRVPMGRCVFKEEGVRNPVKVCVYTGIAYIMTVLLLVFPFFIFHNPFWALGLTVSFVALVIFIFTFYVAVAKGINFKTRFSEMLGIALGVTVLNFLIGLLIRKYLSI